MTLEELIQKYPRDWEYDSDTGGWTNCFRTPAYNTGSIKSNEATSILYSEISDAIVDYMTRDLEFDLEFKRGYQANWKVMKYVGEFKNNFVNSIRDTFDKNKIKIRRENSQNISKSLEDAFQSDSLWTNFFENTKYEVDFPENYQIETSVAYLDGERKTIYNYIGSNFPFAEVKKEILSNDKESEIIGYWVGFDFKRIKESIDTILNGNGNDGFKVELFGTIKTKDSAVVEDLYHSTPGDWKDLPIDSERPEAVKLLEDNLKSQVEEGSYHSYSIQDFGAFTRLTTVPFKTEPFEEKFTKIRTKP